jgi:hypothetical protein
MNREPNEVVVTVLQRRQIVQDWIRVEDCEVASREFRTFEYHVVAEEESDRVVLTIKCFDSDAQTVRLDPNALTADIHESAFADIATRRVKQLFANGMI